MSSERFRFIPLSLAFILPLFMYARWPSYLWNVDGVACAAALELGNPVYLFHADHLIYGGLGYAFWKCLLLPIGVHSALPALQIMTFALTAVGLLGLFLLLASQEIESWTALALTLSIAASAVVWVWSVEAQVYSVGFAALAWATYVLFEGKTLAALRWTGILGGVAILGHLMHGLWLGAAAYWIFRDRDHTFLENSRRFGIVFLYAMVTASLAYFLVLKFVLLPAHLSHPAFMNWIKGSIGLTPDRHWAWHTEGRSAPLQWARSSISFFWGTFWRYGPGPFPSWLKGLTIVSILLVSGLLAASFRSTNRRRRHFALVWIGLYALLLLTWEPSTLCYRMTEGIPLALLMGLGLSPLKPMHQRIYISLVLLSLFLITWRTRIAPMNRPENNILYGQTLGLAQQTPEHSLYLTGGGITWIYLLYFTHRTAWNVHLVPPEKIEAAMASYKKDGAVLLDANTYNQPDAPAWITSRRWAPMQNLPWMELQ